MAGETANVWESLDGEGKKRAFDPGENDPLFSSFSKVGATLSFARKCAGAPFPYVFHFSLSTSPDCNQDGIFHDPIILYKRHVKLQQGQLGGHGGAAAAAAAVQQASEASNRSRPATANPTPSSASSRLQKRHGMRRSASEAPRKELYGYVPGSEVKDMRGRTGQMCRPASAPHFPRYDTIDKRLAEAIDFTRVEESTEQKEVEPQWRRARGNKMVGIPS